MARAARGRKPSGFSLSFMHLYCMVCDFSILESSFAGPIPFLLLPTARLKKVCVLLGEGVGWVLMGQAGAIVLGEASLKVLLIVGSFWDPPVVLCPGNLPMSCGALGDFAALPWGSHPPLVYWGVCGGSTKQARNLIVLSGCLGGLPVRLYTLYTNRNTQKYTEGLFELTRKCLIIMLNNLVCTQR